MNSITRRLFTVLLAFVILSTLAIACTPRPKVDLARGASMKLATFSQHSVDVNIELQRGTNGQTFLSAVFTPAPGYHLYSKDMPRYGVGGLGRPTLLELGENSKMETLGKLIESVGANVSTADPSGVLIYPDGPVTMTLPIRLPDGDEWAAEEILLTYMACSATGCKPPVQGEVISVKVPASGALSD
jgi:hypothetical protein